MNFQDLDEKTGAIIGMIIEEVFRNERQGKITRLGGLNKYALKGQILFTGSSLMEHFPIEEFCIAEGIQSIIYNRGVGGFTTDDFLRNIHTVLLELDPSRVFINIGTNDISESIAPDGDWLNHLITNYDCILTQLKAQKPNCDVYLMAYYPTNQAVIAGSPFSKQTFGLRTQENINKANREVEKLAVRYGYHYINANAGLADVDGDLKAEYTTDGVHMTPDAYFQVFRNLKPYL
ncbi:MULTISPECIES: GDSL-type esterase/lipase family protein [Clostridia]|uniref:GDSL-type esterase/lipase family protein n=1 Tax=Clostridia TaxID=186801 RepID=UPI000A74120D|nr:MULTISPECIES: GDSL-type esterase/lipase family protein [Clostridia]